MDAHRPSAETRTVRLAILESYGVEWSLETFARDVIQNFFDATPDFRRVVFAWDAAERALTVSGPSEFDVDLLAYLGATTKNDGRTAGGFGEGFKICALVGTRDFGLAVRAGSGDTEIEVFFDPVPLGRELCYRVTRAPGAGRTGSFVRLGGCSDACVAAFDAARDMFFHDGNPKLGRLVAEDDARTVAVHAAASPGHGEIYYRRQQRGSVRYYGYGFALVPLTFACHEAHDDLEGDRDRRELSAARVAKIVGGRLPPQALHATVLALMAQWSFGHDALRGLLEAAVERELRFDWPQGWIARTHDPRDAGLSTMAERQGLRLAVSSFAALGMPTARARYSFDLQTRPPTPVERARLEAGVALYSALLGTEAKEMPLEVFDDGRAAVLGQHLGDRMIVAAKLLRPGGFAAATSTVLHELAHEVGGEDSAAFANRLGRLLGAAIRFPERVEKARERFDRARPARPPKEPAPELEAYVPEDALPGRRASSGVRCVVYAPPAFPPLERIAERLRSAARAVGTRLRVRVVHVTSAAQARRLGLPGVPTLRVEGRDVDPEGARRRPGYRVRTYGDERAVCPGEEAVRASLEASPAGKKLAALAALASPPPVDPAEAERFRSTGQARIVQWRCFEWAGYKEKRGLARAWPAGLDAACQARIAVHAPDAALDEDALYRRVLGDVRAGIEASRALRQADRGFEAGDDLEELAMAAAQGAFVAGFAQPGDRGGQARGERDFLAVRDAWRRLVGEDLAPRVREATMVWCQGRTGLSVTSPAPSGLDAAAYGAAFEVALVEARRYQRALDAEERGPDGSDLFALLDAAIDPGAAARAKATAAAEKRTEARERAHAARTLAVKAAWDEALAKGEDEVAAAKACLAAAARIFGGA